MIRRILLALALVLIGLPVMLVAAAVMVANTDWGRARIAQAVEDATAEGPVRVRIEHLSGSFPRHIRIDGLQFSDASGGFGGFDRVELEWSPYALLWGEVAINVATVAGGQISRAPVLPEDPTEYKEPTDPLSIEIPELPVAIDIAAFRIDGVRLGEALAGTAVRIDAKLAAEVTGSAATASGWLSADAEQGATRIDLDLAVVPENDTLRAELRAREPTDGFVAGLLGLSGAPALDLTLTGTGALVDWKGRLEGGFGEGASLALALGVSSEADRRRIAVDGTAALERLLPPPIRPLAGPAVGVALTAEIMPDGTVDLTRAHINAAAAELDGTARLDAEGKPVAADATLRTPRLDAFTEIAGAALSGTAETSLRLTDDGRRVRVEVAGSPAVAGTPLSGLHVTVALEADAPLAELPETIRWALEAAVDTPALADLDLPAQLGPRIVAEAAGSVGTDGREATVERLAIVGDDVRLDGTATLADGERIETRAKLALADLATFSSLAGRTLAGSATADVEATVRLSPLDVSGLIDVAAEGLALGDPALESLIGSSPTVGAGFTFDADEHLAVRGLALQAGAMQASGDLDIALADGTLGGQIDVTAPDLAVVGRAVPTELAGEGAASIALGGTLSAPAASASWRLAPLIVQETSLDEVTGSATVTGLPDRPSGHLDLRAAASGETLVLGADYALTGERLAIDALSLEGAGLRARGNLAVALGGPVVDGSIAFSSADLSQLGRFAGAPISAGSLDLKVDLAGRNGQTARLSGRLDNLVFDDGEATTEIAAVTLSGNGHDLLGRPSGAIRTKITGIRQGDEVLVETARLTAEAEGGQARVTASAEGEAGVPYDFSAEASAALGAEPMRIDLDALDGRIADVSMALDRPTRITLGKQLLVDDLALRVEGGTIRGGGRLDPKDLDLTLAVRGLPAGLARLADPTVRIAGEIDADLAVKGPVGDPTARFSLSAPAIRPLDPALADMPPLTVAAEGRVEDRRLTVSLDATSGDAVEGKVRAALALAAGAAGAPPTFDENAPLDARVDVEAALAQLGRYLPLDVRVAGQASLHVAVTGSPANPQVDGTASLTGGEIDLATIGLYLRDVRLNARGQGEQLVIETLTASAVSGGRLQGSGWFSFDVAEGMPADLRIIADDLVAFHTDEATVAVDSDLGFTGKLPEYRLAGTVTVLPSEIRIPEQLPPSVVELQVTEVRDGVVVRSEQDGEHADAGGGVPIVLDVRVGIPGQVFVRGRGLDSEWGGDLHVTGPADAPEVVGELQVRRGRFDVLGRSLNFERGVIAFQGGPPDDPALDMLLATEVAEITAQVVIGGHAQDPSIELRSQPPLPQEEVLSRILFGSSRAQLSPLQALKLAQSAAVLSGRLGSSGGITDTVRTTLGVDTLDLNTGDEESGTRGASLSVGKYIAPGVFLKLQQGLGQGGSRAVVEIELTDTITVETDVGADSQSRVGLNWKLDY